MKIYLTVILLATSFSALSDEKYSLAMISSNGKGSWGAIRYIPETGQSWFVKGQKFVEILERSLPHEGHYQVNMVETKSGWGAMRINRNSGETWFLNKQIWQPVQEPGDN